MTSIITVSAHPALPNTVVEVSVYDNATPTSQNYVLQDGGIQTFTISGEQTIHINETNTVVVAPYVATPEPTPSDPPVIEQPALSTTG